MNDATQLATREPIDKLTATVFAQGMALLAERWNREISPGMSRIYANALKDLGGALFIVGVTRAIEELTFFPSAAEIRKLARPEVAPEARAGALLASVDACGVHGPHGRTWSIATVTEKCGSAAALAFIAIGGGRRLAGMADADFPFALRDFAKALGEYSEQAIAKEIVARRLEAVRNDPALGAGKQAARGLSPLADSIAAAIPAEVLPRTTEPQ